MTFLDWLHQQTHRHDLVGAIAQAITADNCLTGVTPARILSHVQSCHETSDVARAALRAASREYRTTTAHPSHNQQGAP